uniref:GRAM domain-containing protein n=1 Tax=Steinernema glaseri TaxID=37863 RepID=A0A1I8ANR6_9BILA
MVWVKPEDVIVQSFWVNECANPYFVLQRRKGHGTSGLGSLFVATIDSMFDTRPPPFRILYQVETETVQVAKMIAVGVIREEIQENWEWLERNVLPTLDSFESEIDVRTFVVTKIEGLCSIEDAKTGNNPDEADNVSNRAVITKFHELFRLPASEKLVNFYICSLMKGRIPYQGQMYLSVNYLCFYSFIMGKQTNIKLKWTDIIKLEKNTHFFISQSMTVVTRTDSFNFTVFVNFDETYQMASQLANMAMKQRPVSPAEVPRRDGRTSDEEELGYVRQTRSGRKTAQ